MARGASVRNVVGVAPGGGEGWVAGRVVGIEFIGNYFSRAYGPSAVGVEGGYGSVGVKGMRRIAAADGRVCNGGPRMSLVKRESTSNGDCHWAWKLKPDRVADAGVHFLRDRIHGERTRRWLR